MDRPSDFTIKKVRGRRRDHYVLVNKKGERKHHTHLHGLNTCHMLVRLVCNKIVPNKKWLRDSALRISRDEKYKENVRHKIEKDKQKPNYNNRPKVLR